MHCSDNYYAPRRRKTMLGVHCIEGQYVTVDDIAARLNVTPRIARNRLSNARKAADKVTWANLGERNE